MALLIQAITKSSNGPAFALWLDATLPQNQTTPLGRVDLALSGLASKKIDGIRVRQRESYSSGDVGICLRLIKERNCGRA